MNTNTVTQKQKNLAIFQTLLCAAMWSTAGIFIKQIPWNPLVIASFRSLIASMVCIIYMRMKNYRVILSRKTLSSAVALCFTMMLFVAANKLTTSANAIALQFTDPIFIMIISAVFFGKKFKKTDIIAVTVTFCGIVLFFIDSLDSGKMLGNIIAIVSGITFACYYISLGESAENERMSAIFLAQTMTFLVGLPFTLTTNPLFSVKAVISIIVLGIVQLGIPYVLLAKGAEYCPPLACALLGALEPLLNPIWVFIFDGEAPGMFALIGGAVVIITITAWCIYNDKAEKKKESADLWTE